MSPSDAINRRDGGRRSTTTPQLCARVLPDYLLRSSISRGVCNRCTEVAMLTTPVVWDCVAHFCGSASSHSYRTRCSHCLSIKCFRAQIRFLVFFLPSFTYRSNPLRRNPGDPDTYRWFGPFFFFPFSPSHRTVISSLEHFDDCSDLRSHRGTEEL